METEETNQLPPPAAEPQIILTEEMQYYLQKAGQWAYFLGIMGFIATAFILLCALFVGALMGAMSALQPAATPIPASMSGFLSFIYVLVAAFYFFFSLYLYQFGDRIKSGILYVNAAEITTALSKLKSFFKLWGISTIVIIGLYLLFFIVLITVGIGAVATR